MLTIVHIVVKLNIYHWHKFIWQNQVWCFLNHRQKHLDLKALLSWTTINHKVKVITQLVPWCFFVHFLSVSKTLKLAVLPCKFWNYKFKACPIFRKIQMRCFRNIWNILCFLLYLNMIHGGKGDGVIGSPGPNCLLWSVGF